MPVAIGGSQIVAIVKTAALCGTRVTGAMVCFSSRYYNSVGPGEPPSGAPPNGKENRVCDRFLSPCSNSSLLGVGR